MNNFFGDCGDKMAIEAVKLLLLNTLHEHNYEPVYSKTVVGLSYGPDRLICH